MFSVDCALDHQAKDDPIVFFGQPSATHIHDFFGARGVDAYTTADAIRGAATTCGHPGDTAAYWAPALIAPDGTVVQPTNMLAYYQAGRAVRALPFGLVMVADGFSDPGSGFSCDHSDPVSPTPIDCPVGELKLHVHFPYCWDGVNLDSPDHRSHMSFTCDAAHPIELVRLAIHVQYKGVSDGASYHLAPSPNGSIPAVHADFMQSWSEGVLERIVAECVNAGVNCKKNVTVGLQ